MPRSATLAAGFALARVAYGAALTAAPRRVAGGWLPEDAGRPGTQVAIRGLGVRDVALAGGVLLAASVGSAPLSVGAVLLMGFCFGPVFPTALAIATAAFRRAPGTAASVVVAMGSAGGMLLPWLQGALLERVGPAASVLLVAAGTLAMLALHVGRGLVGRQPTADRRRLTADTCG